MANAKLVHSDFRSLEEEFEKLPERLATGAFQFAAEKYEVSPSDKDRVDLVVYLRRVETPEVLPDAICEISLDFHGDARGHQYSDRQVKFNFLTNGGDSFTYDGPRNEHENLPELIIQLVRVSREKIEADAAAAETEEKQAWENRLQKFTL